MLEIVARPKSRPFKRARGCRSCRYGLGDLPWTLRDRRLQLRDNFHRLRNQAVGAGGTPRSDLPGPLQTEIEGQYRRFLAWEDNLTRERVIAEATGTYEDELVEWEGIYRGLAQTLATALQAISEVPAYQTLAPAPAKPPTTSPTTTPLPEEEDNTTRNVLLAVGGAGLLAALYYWSK